uniref:WD40 repeat containing protein n=1 Tax=Toxoplasma gondii (strain ATCC 50861 / VEG) TaxID=432359 RepID=A0A0F7USM8_TOXGV|nr:TPA: WD40 repeat containing protein [Toxoplasma gondii VEG]
MRVLFEAVSTDSRLPVVCAVSSKSCSTSIDATPLWPAPVPDSGLCGDAEWIALDENGDSADPQPSSWSAFGKREYLLTANRDGRICRWSRRESTSNNLETVLTVAGTTVTCFAAVPCRRRDISDSFDHPTEEPCIVVGTEDGSLRCFRQRGCNQEWIEEAIVPEAHASTVTSVKWSPDGSHFVSAGDDGKAKLWSRLCQARPFVEKCDAPIAAVSWSNSADALVLGFGETIRVATTVHLVPDATSRNLERSNFEWRAHEGAVLAVDWSKSMIISGGEDGHYKIWSRDGTLLFTGSSAPHVSGDACPPDTGVNGKPFSPVTAVRWSPSGDTFAVGASDWIAICDKSGRIRTQTFREFGLPHTLAWTRDGTHIAVAGVPSLLAIGRIIPDAKRWRNVEVSVDSDSSLLLKDLSSQASRTLEQTVGITQWTIACGSLLVVTNRQCFVYKLAALACLEECQPAYIDDLQQPCCFAKQGFRHACLVQSSQIQVDAQDPYLVRVFDILTGSAIASPPAHSIGIKEVALDSLFLRYPCGYVCVKISLSQQENTLSRKLAILDDAGDLLLSPLHSPCWKKLNKFPVQSFAWDEITDTLASISNSTVVCWLVPAAAFLSGDLLEESQITKETGDQNLGSQIVAFQNGYLTMQRPDGAMLQVAVAPELGTAEVAFAALGSMATVHQLQRIQSLNHPIRRAAEIALLCHQTDEAVHILVKHGLVYRALEILMEVHRWQEALHLAVASKLHVDTVVAHRKKFLDGFGLSETDSKFKAALQAIEIDWPAIHAKIQRETEEEEKEATVAALPAQSKGD